MCREWPVTGVLVAVGGTVDTVALLVHAEVVRRPVPHVHVVDREPLPDPPIALVVLVVSREGGAQQPVGEARLRC